MINAKRLQRMLDGEEPVPFTDEYWEALSQTIPDYFHDPKEERAVELELGQMAKDTITGFEGVVMAKAQYLTGCNQILLTPARLDKDGKRIDGEWFDDSRVTGEVKKTGTGFTLARLPGNGGPQDQEAPKK